MKVFLGIKNLVLAFVLLLLFSFHPYYISVSDIKYKTEEKILQVSCKTFTDNTETALKKIYAAPIDLLHPKNKAVAEKMLAHYIITHLKITVNGKLLVLDFIGYEKEEDAIWSYFEVKEVSIPTTIKIENTLLYESFPAQINMVHTEVSGKKQSAKVSNPEKEMEFTY